MSGVKGTDANVQVPIYDTTTEKVDTAYAEHSEQPEANPMPSSKQEEEVIKKKYGGIIPKKPPLISKDHERAYFDSADWALGKGGHAKPKGPLEALRPKLQPTPQQQVRSRRSSYATNESEDGGNAGSDDLMDSENNNQ